ncbi:unnamed protein product [Boreogadus saida]
MLLEKMALNQDTILTFLLEHGGKVTNAELLNCFKSQIHCGDPAGKQHNRDLFKKLVNSVAVVKQIDGVKFVVTKKRFRDFVKGDGEGLESGDGGAHQDPSLRTAASPLHSTDQAESAEILHNLQNNNACYSFNLSGNFKDDTIYNHSEAMALPINTNSCTENEQSLKIVNISSDYVCIKGESGAVFAVVSVSSPPSTPIRPHDFNSETPSEYTTPDKPFPVKSLSQTVPAVNRFCQIFERNTHASKSCENLTELMLNGQGSPTDTGSQSSITRKVEDSDSVPLDPIAHEWLVKCSAGMWRHVYGLLLLDTQFVNKRDFLSGFTALHWAVKGGNGEMVRKIMDISKSKGTCVDVNSKTHGGYTPLHIAALHGHSDIITLLVQGYGARVNVRDNAGKKPYHYLGTCGTLELKELLGGRQREHCRDPSEEEEYRLLLPKGLNTISKLFQPHMGHRRKHRHQQPPGFAVWDGF